MTSKSLPKDVKFFLADDIRADSSLKPTLFGMYPDNIVRPLMKAGQPVPTIEAPIVLQSLAILVVLVDCKGSFEAEISLFQPNGKALVDSNKLDGGLSSGGETVEKTNINFIANFMPFSIPEFGQYRFVIKLDGQSHEHKFEVSGKLQQ